MLATVYSSVLMFSVWIWMLKRIDEKAGISFGKLLLLVAGILFVALSLVVFSQPTLPALLSASLYVLTSLASIYFLDKFFRGAAEGAKEKRRWYCLFLAVLLFVVGLTQFAWLPTFGHIPALSPAIEEAREAVKESQGRQAIVYTIAMYADAIFLTLCWWKKANKNEVKQPIDDVPEYTRKNRFMITLIGAWESSMLPLVILAGLVVGMVTLFLAYLFPQNLQLMLLTSLVFELQFVVSGFLTAILGFFYALRQIKTESSLKENLECALWNFSVANGLTLLILGIVFILEARVITSYFI